MAFRTWVKLLLATLGVAALAGASQLGVAYGLGILRLTRVLDVTTRDQWTAQLAWVCWFAMVAAVLGALAGARLLPRLRPSGVPALTAGPATPSFSFSPAVVPAGIAFALAVAAGIGSAIVVPLTMQPARTAQVAGVDPVVVIGICAGLGAVVGVFAAWAAVTQVVARWSLTALGLAVWVIALISVSSSLAPSDPLPAVRLGVFDASFLSTATTQRTALFTLPALALIAGAVLGWQARRQGRPTLTIALAGLPGPALLTLAYLIAGPGAGDDRYQVVPYWAAMTATGAGVLGSVLAAVLRNGQDDPAGDEPTEGRPPLPRRTSADPDSAATPPETPPAGSAAAALPSFGPPSSGLPPLGSPPAGTRASGPRSGGSRSSGSRSGGSTPSPSETGSLPRPSETGSIPRPSETGSIPRPSQTGSLPDPFESGSIPRPPQSGSAPRPAATGSTPRPYESGSIPRPYESGSIPRPAETGVIDVPSGAVRSAPRNPQAKPWAPTPGAPSTPLGAPPGADAGPPPSGRSSAAAAAAAGPAAPTSRRASAVEAFKARTSSWPSSRQPEGRRSGKQAEPKLAADNPTSVALGDYAEPEPFDGFAPTDTKLNRPANVGQRQQPGSRSSAARNSGQQQPMVPQATAPQATVPQSAARPNIPGVPTHPVPEPATRPASDATGRPGSQAPTHPGSQAPTHPGSQAPGRPGQQPPAAPGSSKHAAPMVIAQPDRGPASRGAEPRGGSARGGKRRGSEPAGIPEAAPGTAGSYVPEPATRPLSPEVIGGSGPEPTQSSRGTAPGRGLRSFGRGRGADPQPSDVDGPGRPLTPEPQAVSAPLPQPTPVSPPLPVTPARSEQPAAEPEADSGKRRFGRKRKSNTDYVDWVSGLGND